MPKHEGEPPKELFASIKDIVTAHIIVEQELGDGLDVNYLAFPRSTGVMGDEGVRGHSLVISALSGQHARAAYADPEHLAELSLRLTNETQAASRVLFDITPGGGFFKPDTEHGKAD